jgi:leader peptidase (prepilin peptidase)/N-methyltransferase
MSVAGAMYAAALWSIAERVARRRHLALGSRPYLAFVLSAVAGASINVLLPPDIRCAAFMTLGGTIVCAIVDARTGLIFDALTLTVAAAVCAELFMRGALGPGLLAGAIVGGLLLCLHALTHGRGLGLGDVKLGAVVGLGSGLTPGLVAIGCAFVLGAAYALVLLVAGRLRRSDAVRFGPFIAGGTAASLAAGVLGWMP